MASPSVSESLPFPAGTSPFHIKGVSYLGHLDYVAEHVPGGQAAVLAAIRDPVLRAFFEQRFLSASWYDVLPMVPVWHLCAKLRGQTSVDFLRERTRHQLQRDVHSVYRFLLKLVSAEAVATRAPRVMQQYLDFGKTEAKVVEPGVVRVVASGLPVLLAPWLRVVTETFLVGALELSGAPPAQLRPLPNVPDGEAHGTPLTTMGFEVRMGAEKP